nr:reverse transcriptase domain-containing protein [Tanacetum cinerariifolium]
MVSKTRDTSKYCEFYQDYDHDTNSCRELKNQIEEVVKSGKLAQLIKGIRKERAKQTHTQLEEWTAPAVNAKPVADEKEEPILMTRVTNNPLKRKEPPRIMSVEEMIFPQYETGPHSSQRKEERLIHHTVRILSKGIRHSKANTPRGAPFDKTRAKVIYGLAVRPSPLNSSITIKAWSHRYTVSSLMDTAYSQSEQILQISSF